MTIRRDYSLTLMLEGPLLSQASGVLGFGLDAAMQRYRGEPVLTGTQIRGNIRHQLYHFRDHAANSSLNSYLPRWFPDENNSFEDYRSPINFDLFWRPLSRDHRKGEVRTRIAIEEETGKVKRGALAISEDLYPSGSCVPFHGVIHARFIVDTERQAFERWLEKALQWLAAVGANKGVGYGRLLYHELEASEPQPLTPPPLPPGSTRLRLRLKLDRPFCIARQVSARDNRFISSVEIPGHVIKGVLARQIAEETNKQGKELSNELRTRLDFDNLVITHAQPVPCSGNHRPRAMPLNLAKIGEDWRFFTEASPGNFEQAPEFQPDWKPEVWQEASGFLKRDSRSPEPWMMVRTAIDRGTGAAAESQLFSMECIDPHGFEWWAEIDLSAVADASRGTVLDNLQKQFAHGLDEIGKTHARARVTLEAIASPAIAQPGGGRWQITLQSAARMLQPGFVTRGVNSSEAMRKAYQDYWNKASNSALELVAWFTQQQLTGGDYYHHRFRVNQGKDYTNELLTCAGSVFILQAVGGKRQEAENCLEKWLRQNLPAWFSDDEPATWEHTIHLPQNGFGEITVEFLAEEGEA